ncbi:MAG: amidohydrolase [Halioglobus sp.]|nr:amidohydrolase [Halioglobus sp.]
MNYDLVLAGGTVIDGTGLARRRADVGIKDGVVQHVGLIPPGHSASRTMDVSGMIVAPGIVDLHTHYDPQLTFDPYATSSCYHGVTTVLAGNCGFSIAPTRVDQRDFITALFAKVEGMSPRALEGVDWAFESFTEYLDYLRGRIGVNVACYVGHSSLRRYVMGEAGSEREATADEVQRMREHLREALEAGAAGFSSSHAPTQEDGQGRRIPSCFGDLDELRALVEEAGHWGRGTISYLPASVIGGLDQEDGELLLQMGELSRLPIIIQGLGGRNKTDVPGAGWPEALKLLQSAEDRGVALYSLLRNHPFDRVIDLGKGCPLYAGVPSWHAIMFLPHEEKLQKLNDPAYRETMRNAVENPNRDKAQGSTLPPPGWDSVYVDDVTREENQQYFRRTILDIANESGKTPADTLLDLALSEDLKMRFRWENISPSWDQSVRESMQHTAMLMGVSDGGAHLDRDDGSDWSSFFLRYWVLDQGLWTLEEGVRRITQVPAALAGFNDRGMLLPGLAADIMVFDPDTVGPYSKKIVHDMPGDEARYSSRPRGIYATIVNGEPIVVDGELTDALPGQVLKPHQA